jgi:phosphopantothenoylcysteine decarboxylase/phosphopantothenate--cysteine ligase
LAKLAYGFADDLLTVTALAARCPLLVAPAMDGNMYQHPATQTNLAILRERGGFIVEPEEGRFASGLVGRGRLPETHTLIGAIRRALGKYGILEGRKLVVTAGGTREALDPVRFITNRSSGKQGYALAQAALDEGADVTLITTVRGLPPPYDAQIIPVDSADQMYNAVMTHMASADALLMAAAVADFRPHSMADHKIKKTEEGSALILTLEKTTDILTAVNERRRDTHWPRVVVGFAAESDNLLEYAREKLERKGVDLLVANDITLTDAGFDSENNRVTILDSSGVQENLDLMSKAKVSEHIIRRVAQILENRPRGQ